MLFSERKKLAEEYEKWLSEKSKFANYKINNCPFNVITFLDSKKLLKDKGENK